MHPLLKDLRNLGNDAQDYARKAIPKSADMANVLVKGFQKYYPAVSTDLRKGAGRMFAPARSAVDISAKEMQSFACVLRKGLYRTELGLITVGAGYLMFKGFFHSHKGEPSPAEKIQTHIEEKPVKSALIAVGVGFLVSRILF